MSRSQYYLRQGLILPALLLVWMTCAVGCARPTAAPPTSQEEEVEESVAIDHHVLRDIRVIDLEVHFDLSRSGSKDIYYSAFKAIDPLRLVLDLPNTVMEKVVSPLAVENEIIGKIETMTLVHESQPLTRIEIGLNRDTAYLIDQGQEEIWVKFYADPQLTEAAAAQGEPVVHPEIEEHQPAAEPAQAVDAPQPAVEGPRVASQQPAGEEPMATSQPATKEPLSQASRILDIQPVTSGEGLNVYIIGNGKLDNYHAFVLRNPPRLVLDLVGVRSSEVKDALNLTGPRVKQIRLGSHADKLRVVFDLKFISKSEIPYEIIEKEDRLVVSFEPDSGASF